MHIVFVASEMVPFSKAGGLADVVSSLASSLVKAGRKVTVVLPATGRLESSPLALSRRLLPLTVPMGLVTYNMEILEGRLPSGVEVRLLCNEAMFERQAVYTDAPDEPLRWGLLCLGAIALMAHENEKVDIVHVHDWHTALVPCYLRHMKERPRNLDRCATVLTVHNLHHQGIFDREVVEKLGLPWDGFRPDGFEFYGKLNILKAGLLCADRVTTVSPTYAKEILETAEGVGLDGVLRSLTVKVKGILNGIDTDAHDPARDLRIPARFDADDIGGKQVCKRALQEKLGLPDMPRTPLVVMVSRLVPQKGVDLLLAMAPRLLRSDVQIAVLGDGDEDVAQGLGKLVQRYPEKVVFRRGFDEDLATSLFAAGDILVVPSRFEPCGLTQLIGMRYGAIPVVRRTGGLADTVVDLDRSLESGNGFTFTNMDAVEFLGAVLRAVVSYSSVPEWKELVRRVMRTDVSWKRSARRYAQLYDELMG